MNNNWTMKVMLTGAFLILSACTAPSNSTNPSVGTNPDAKQTNSNVVTANPATNTFVPVGGAVTFTLAEIALHNSSNDCWIAIKGKVYNVTSYISQHPGGEKILNGCGKDATQLFENIRKHSGPEAQAELPKFEIGTQTN